MNTFQIMVVVLLGIICLDVLWRASISVKAKMFVHRIRKNADREKREWLEENPGKTDEDYYFAMFENDEPDEDDTDED